MEHLVKGDWPKLKCLDLSKHGLGLSAVQALSKGTWPCTLLLGNNKFGAVVIKKLGNNDWPMLQWLDLQCNILNEDAVFYLTCAYCPQ